MKNKGILFFGSTVCALLLFGCATGNKVSKVSYGGGWAEAKSTPKTEQSTTPDAKTVESTESVVITETDATIPGISNSTTLSASNEKIGGSNNVNVTEEKMAKPSFKQKMAAKMISKQMAKPHDTKDGDKLLYVIIAILLPWLGVLLYEGGITSNFWITLLLWFLFYLPGLIYALLVILDYI